MVSRLDPASGWDWEALSGWSMNLRLIPEWEKELQSR